MIGLIDADSVKLCTKCNITKSVLEFSNQKFRNDGLYPFCRICLKNENFKYKTSINGLINSTYSGMKRRVNSINPEHKYWFKKEILLKSEFVTLINLNKFKCLRLYVNWKINNFNKNLTPSVDRINSNIGYTKTNITFIPTQENRYKAVLKRWEKQQLLT